MSSPDSSDYRSDNDKDEYDDNNADPHPRLENVSDNAATGRTRADSNEGDDDRHLYDIVCFVAVHRSLLIINRGSSPRDPGLLDRFPGVLAQAPCHTRSGSFSGVPRMPPVPHVPR